MRRAPWMMAFAVIAASCGCDHETVNPAPRCFVTDDCNGDLDDRCSEWSCRGGECVALPVDGNGYLCGDLPMCRGVCVYPHGSERPGHCEGAASAPVVCGGDGSCDDGNPCTIDEGLAPACLHYNLPRNTDCEAGVCDAHGVCCNQCVNSDGHCGVCPTGG